jgi:hypothetical protein
MDPLAEAARYLRQLAQHALIRATTFRSRIPRLSVS